VQIYFKFSRLLFYLKTLSEHLYNTINVTDIPLHCQLQQRLEDVIKIEITFSTFNNYNVFLLICFFTLTFYEICNLYQSAEVNSNTKNQLNVQTVQYSQIHNFSTFSKYCHLIIWFKLTITKPTRQINVMLMCTIYQYIIYQYINVSLYQYINISIYHISIYQCINISIYQCIIYQYINV
jgi:hypothetical protein